MHAGKLEAAVKTQLGLAPIHGRVFCEEASGIFHFDETGKKSYVGPSSIRIDTDFDGLSPARDFSFGNGVTIDAVRTDENRWVYAIWFVFAPELKQNVDEKYDQLRALLLSHRSAFPAWEPVGSRKHKIRHGKHWFQIKNGTDSRDQTSRTDVLLGRRDAGDKHAHLIFKNEEIIVGGSLRDVPPERITPQFKMVSASKQGVVRYEYQNISQKLVQRIQEQTWPATTTSNTPVDLGFMSITVTPATQASRFVCGFNGDITYEDPGTRT